MIFLFLNAISYSYSVTVTPIFGNSNFEGGSGVVQRFRQGPAGTGVALGPPQAKLRSQI